MNDIVIARYSEDLKWIDLIDKSKYNFIIYNKGSDVDMPNIKLNNIGRESHTFLYHILENYDNLPEYTIFLQGEPFEHCTNLYRKERNILFQEHLLKKACYYDFINLYSHPEFHGFDLLDFLNNQKISNRDLGDALIVEGRWYYTNHCDELFINAPNTYEFIAGAQYCVHRDNILRRSKEFYQMCFDLHFIDNDFPWMMERFWKYIFFYDTITKK